MLGHTRWASVGIISEANAHPLNSEEDGGRAGPYVVAALNGDVDNFADLKAGDGLRIAAEITTDAKVIPTLVSRKLRAGVALDEAFRSTVASFEGSVAIGANAASSPNQVLLALRGSGQALYVGLADDAYIVASEPYGLVEETAALHPHGRRDAGEPRQPECQPRPGARARRRSRGIARGHPPHRVRRHRAARHRRRRHRRRRSRHATSTAAPTRTSC